MPNLKAFGLEAGGLAGTQIGTTGDGRPIVAWPAGAVVNEVLDPIEGDPSDDPNWTGDDGQVDGGGDPSPGNGGESWRSNGAGSLTNSDDTLAKQGDTVCSWVQSDTGNTVGMWFGVSDANNLYYVYFTPSTPELRIGKYVDGAGTDFDSTTSFTVSDPADWFLLELAWYEDGTMEAAVKPDHDSSALASVSGSDSTYTSGGVGVEFTEANQNWDHFQRCEDAVVVVDDFEDGAPEWTLNGAAESASYAWKGSQSLEVEDVDGHAYSTSGLPAYPKAGDVYQARFLNPAGDGGGGTLEWGFQDTNNFYLGRHGWTDGTVELRKNEAGSVTTLASGSWGGPDGEFLRGTVDWATDGTMVYDLDREDETDIIDLSATDTTFTSGGIGHRAWSGTVYYDYLRVK